MHTLDLENLVDLERAGWDALCASRGAAFYGELMTPEAVMVLVDGSVLDRDAVVASLDDAPPWDSYELTDTRRLPLGPDTAALVYCGTAEREHEENPFSARMTSVYTLVDGRPRLALYQQTALDS
ncbi:nuclear transport factor 2 family protein [uncultured Leifsonia sp.]|uniref:nuclear transport factor 2 family protein n=1 Tax=uncultured Leifsonia sp. TaxID=340359 RepID=UPI0025D79A47|nr:nuclear transport factor 2 family protein [uncultured Leifsonia sp.]